MEGVKLALRKIKSPTIFANLRKTCLTFHQAYGFIRHTRQVWESRLVMLLLLPCITGEWGIQQIEAERKL